MVYDDCQYHVLHAVERGKRVADRTLLLPDPLQVDAVGATIITMPKFPFLVVHFLIADDLAMMKIFHFIKEDTGRIPGAILYIFTNKLLPRQRYLRKIVDNVDLGEEKTTKKVRRIHIESAPAGKLFWLDGANV